MRHITVNDVEYFVVPTETITCDNCAFRDGTNNNCPRETDGFLVCIDIEADEEGIIFMTEKDYLTGRLKGTV